MLQINSYPVNFRNDPNGEFASITQLFVFLQANFYILLHTAIDFFRKIIPTRKRLPHHACFCIFDNDSINPADSVFVPGGQLNSLLDAAIPSLA